MFVIIFTLLEIDTSSEKLGAEAFTGGVFYFGNMSSRGALTYISFALLLVPLIFNHINQRMKILILTSSGFLFAIMFIVLKRFAFVTVILGFINYITKSSISMKLKIRIVIGAISIIVLVFSTTNLHEIVFQRYETRGAELKFGREAIEGDIRIYEPLYAFNYVFEGAFTGILFGTEFERYLDIDSERHTMSKRQIHNQYASHILRYGLFGLFTYLYIFFVLYRITLRFRKELLKRNINVNEYWIVFQNLVLIFIVAGMVGGHIHITFRGMVLLFAGGISGYFYKLLNQNIIKT